MAQRRRHGVLKFVAAVAGISLATPYVLSMAASTWPNSVVAKLNTGIHKGSS
jgi:hypothetical protein